MNTQMTRLSRQRGFSLIEVMVSTVVALFATLAIMQSFAVSEGYRRTATSGGDASFSGAVGAYLMDRDLRMAGYGINVATYLGCPVSGIDQVGVAPARAINFTLAPVQITPGATAQNPDSITVVSSGATMMPGPINLTTGLAGPTNDYTVTDAFGVNAGDVLLLAEAGKTCVLAQATNTATSGASNQNVVKHASGTYSYNGSTVSARYNPAGGLSPDLMNTGVATNYSASAVVMDMGGTPTANTYYILNNALTVDQLVSGQLAQPIASNVVQLKALYGKDTNADGIVDTWNNVAPVTSADWANVLALRLALVARSAQPEKPDPTTGVCSTTTVAPSVAWDDGTVTVLDVSATAPIGPAWQCYRYKVFHMTSSLRNLIWTPS
jgi:type IV pilus assembly protein PilW